MKIFPNKCKRCGMRYPAVEGACPHCAGLSDEQLRSIRVKHGHKGGHDTDTGRLLIYIAGLAVVILVIYSLNQI